MEGTLRPQPVSPSGRSRRADAVLASGGELRFTLEGNSPSGSSVAEELGGLRNRKSGNLHIRICGGSGEQSLLLPGTRPTPLSVVSTYASRITFWWRVHAWLPAIRQQFWLLSTGVSILPCMP